MSQPSLDPNVVHRAPRRKAGFNVYTVMLLLSFLALMVADILLLLEMNAWGPFPPWKVGG